MRIRISCRGLLKTLERGVPRQGRAFDANGKLQNSFEGLQVAHFLPAEGRLAAHHVEKAANQLPGFGQGLADEFLRHDGSRGGADRAAFAVEFQLGNPAAVEPGGNIDFVAAQRIGIVGNNVRWIHFALVARAAIVIQDDFLIEFFQHCPPKLPQDTAAERKKVDAPRWCIARLFAHLGATFDWLADNNPAPGTLGVNAHKPAINQVGDDQTRFMVVTREPGHDINNILQLQYVLPDTVFHVGHLCLIRRTTCPFRFKKSHELLGG